jgi:hypothetical protein
MLTRTAFWQLKEKVITTAGYKEKINGTSLSIASML